jgi:hypothetical protein
MKKVIIKQIVSIFIFLACCIVSLLLSFGVFLLAAYVIYRLDWWLCQSFIGDFEEWRCSFTNHLDSVESFFLGFLVIPFVFFWTLPLCDLLVKKITYPLFTIKTKIIRHSLAYIVSPIISFPIIIFYNSYLVDTLHIFPGNLFWIAIFAVWPLSYFLIYNWLWKNKKSSLNS